MSYFGSKNMLGQAAFGGPPLGPSGGAGGGGSVWSPPEISNVQVWLRADQGIILNGSNVNVWEDQSGNGNDFSNATPSQQPLFVANAINGIPAVRGDGTNHSLNSSGWAQTQPLLYWIIGKQISWANNKRICGQFSRASLIQSSSSPTIIQSAGFTSNANDKWVLDTYKRIEVLFSGTDSYLKVGDNVVGFANPGPAAITDGILILEANIEIAEFLVIGGEPSAGEKAAFDAYISESYGEDLLTV